MRIGNGGNMIITNRKAAIMAITEYTPIKLYLVADSKYHKMYSAVFINHTADTVYSVTKVKRQISIMTYHSFG